MMEFYDRLSHYAYFVRTSKELLEKENISIYDRIEIQRRLEIAEKGLKELETE